MIDIAFINESNEETNHYESLITSVFHEVMNVEKIEDYREVSVIFVTNERIQEINRDYRGKDAITDVISFALMDEEDGIAGIDIPSLGDIFICVDRAKEQAREYGHSLDREMGFLACHGLLHLLGYDHMVKEEEELMFTKQEMILERVNLRRKGEEYVNE